MPGNPVKLGPFKGGLNNKSQVGEARPDELVELINLEVTADEALTSRPPYELLRNSSRTTVSPGTNWKILCVFRSSPTEWYLIVSEPVVVSGVDKLRVCAYLNGDLTSAPTNIETPTSVEDEVSDAVQFMDEVFFIRNSSSSLPGFKWGPQTVYTQIAVMPRGRAIVSWKSRLWIGGRTDASGIGAQLRYSEILPDGPKPDQWPSSNYVDIAYGEGGFITSIIPLQNSLIVFKSDGTWRFTYPSKVKDGSVDVISSSIGAASRHSVVELENVIYLYDQGSVYEMVNSTFSKINEVLEIREDPEAVNTYIPDVEMSVVNRRIIIRYSNAVYALNLGTKAWSQWRSYLGTPSRFQEIPAISSTANSPVYLATTAGSRITEEIFANNFDGISSLYGTETIDPDGSLLLPPDETVQFSSPFIEEDNSPQSFNFPVATGHTLQMSFIATGSLELKVEVLDAYGAVSPVIPTESIAGSVTTFTLDFKPNISPTGSALLAARIYISNKTVDTVQVSNLSIKRKASNTTASIIRLEDAYLDSATSKELILCRMRTRGIDMGSPQTWKRLYWWGIDIKTYFNTVAVAIPGSKEPRVFWRELDNYTNSQLRQGTYRNPLSWILRSVSVFNRHSAEYDISEDGRFFKKLAKALRFQRISFEFETITHGTLATGPAKLFTITPMVKDKRVVVDTNT